MTIYILISRNTISENVNANHLCISNKNTCLYVIPNAIICEELYKDLVAGAVVVIHPERLRIIISRSSAASG